MSRSGSKKVDTVTLVGVALFTAIVFVLSYFSSYIKFGTFSITLALVPIVIGAALYGRAAGTWLGFVFGMAVLISGDAAAFLSINFAGTILVVLLKGMLAGFIAGTIYKAVEEVSIPLGVFFAAVLCPVVNTGVFLLGSAVFFMDTMRAWSEGMGFGSNIVGFMIFGLVGVNFLLEILVNMILSPVIVRLIQVGTKAKIKSV